MAYNRWNDKGEWGLALGTVFQLVDKSFHMALSNDCVHLPHSKDAASKFHVFGEAVLAPKETQHEMFRTCVPLLNSAEGKRAIMMGPLPRYLYTRCCADKGHVKVLRMRGTLGQCGRRLKKQDKI